MEIRDYLRVLKGNWIIIVAVLILALAIASVYSLAQTPQYDASTKLFVAIKSPTDVQDVTSGNDFTESAVQSYAEVATSSVVLERVIADLGLRGSAQQLAERVSASATLNSVIIDITARDPSADGAALIANSVATNLAAVVGEVAPTANGESPVNMNVIEPASGISASADGPASPNLRLNLVFGALIGLVIGFAIAAFREALARPRRSKRVADASVLEG